MTAVKIRSGGHKNTVETYNDAHVSPNPALLYCCCGFKKSNCTLYFGHN